MQLSRHFSLEEMTRSDYAEFHGIKNEPNKEQLYRLQFLALNVLEPLREAWGAPILVNSGYRSAEVNRGVGGASNSQHMRGEAADIRPVNEADFKALYRLANRISDYDQLLFEYNKSNGKVRCIHISTKIDTTQNRHYSDNRYMI